MPIRDIQAYFRLVAEGPGNEDQRLGLLERHRDQVKAHIVELEGRARRRRVQDRHLRGTLPPVSWPAGDLPRRRPPPSPPERKEPTMTLPARPRPDRPDRLRPGPRLHGHELRLRRPRRRRVRRHHRPGPRARRDLLRHRRHVRLRPQRGAGRQGARPAPRRGRPRHQVRHLPQRRRPQRPRRRATPPTSVRPATPRSGGSAPTTSTSTTSTGSTRPCRSRRPWAPWPSWSRRQGPPPRPERGVGGHDPPGRRGAPDRRAPDRVVDLQPRHRGRDRPLCRELGIGLVPYSPLGRGLLTGAVRQPRPSWPTTTSAAPSRGSRARTSTTTWPSWRWCANRRRPMA